jgi:hypothetical protein
MDITQKKQRHRLNGKHGRESFVATDSIRHGAPEQTAERIENTDEAEERRNRRSGDSGQIREDEHRI